jgi:hypothetical protein
MDTRVDPYREGAQVVSGDVSNWEDAAAVQSRLHLLVRGQHSQIDRSRLSAAKGTARRPSRLASLHHSLYTRVLSDSAWIAV